MRKEKTLEFLKQIFLIEAKAVLAICIVLFILPYVFLKSFAQAEDNSILILSSFIPAVILSFSVILMFFHLSLIYYRCVDEKSWAAFDYEQRINGKTSYAEVVARIRLELLPFVTVEELENGQLFLAYSRIRFSSSGEIIFVKITNEADSVIVKISSKSVMKTLLNGNLNAKHIKTLASAVESYPKV